MISRVIQRATIVLLSSVRSTTRVNDAETRARSPMKRSAVSPSDDGDESDIDDRTAEVRHPL